MQQYIKAVSVFIFLFAANTGFATYELPEAAASYLLQTRQYQPSRESALEESVLRRNERYFSQRLRPIIPEETARSEQRPQLLPNQILLPVIGRNRANDTRLPEGVIREFPSEAAHQRVLRSLGSGPL